MQVLFLMTKMSTIPDPAHPFAEPEYTILAKGMEHLCNGMQLASFENALYGTSESGSLTRIDISTGAFQVVSTELLKPDGLWFDAKSSLLFIGELVTKKMRVYDTRNQALLPEYYTAAADLGKVDLMDDLMVVGEVDVSNLNATKIVAADWTGRKVVEFTLDGSWSHTVPTPPDVELYEPTSVRKGRGPGFNNDAYYVTEGGGATRRITNRRVLQLPANAVY